MVLMCLIVLESIFTMPLTWGISAALMEWIIKGLN